MNSHLKNYSQLFHQEGTARDERFLPALDPGTILLDDRRLKDLLLYVQRLSGHLAFNPGGNGKGPAWKDFLQKDIAILLADIAACSVPKIREAYHLLEGEFDRDRTIGRFNLLVELVFSVFEKLDRWYKEAVAESADGRLRKELRLYIQSYLAKKLVDLIQIRSHAERFATGEERQAIPVYPFINIDQIWGDLAAVDRSYAERVFVGQQDEEKLLNAAVRLKEIYDTVLHVLEQVVGNSHLYLEETLHAKKDHQPHIALMITFLELYGYAREEMNKIPRRHLDFYYEQILSISRRKAVADCVFVSFELGKGFGPCELKKGSLLSAGKDKTNKEMVYATSRDLVVNKAQVNALRTLLIDKDEQGRVLRYYPNGMGLAAAGEASAGALSLFGNKGVGNGRIGFAIASGQFYLAKGERSVIVRFELEKDLPEAPIDGSLLELWLTGEKGWLSSARAGDGVRLNTVGRVEDRVLEFNFTISIGQPSAIVGFNPKIHEGGYEVDLPMLQVLLVGDANGLAGTDVFFGLRPVNTVITVQVGSLNAAASFDGVRDLHLQNHEAILDAKKPFFPFTSIPKVGSSFYIGCDDLFYKPIQRLGVNLEWMLPDHFYSYYDKYLPPYDSNKFRATFSILQKKKWRKLMNTSIIDLDAKDPRWRSIKMDLTAAVRGEDEGGVARFDPSKMDGTLKLKLLYPDFGHGIYSQLITSAVMERASGPGMPDFYKLIRHQLHDSVFSIKLPPNPGDRDGGFKVVIYDVLEGDDPDEKVRSMMIKGVSGIIRYYNERYVGTGPVGTAPAGGGDAGSDPAGAMEPEAGAQRVFVNDDSLLERVLRKLRIIPSTAEYGKEKETVGGEAEKIEKKITPAADFILPDKKELAGIINNVVDSAINQVVMKVVDRILASRKEGVSGQAITTIFQEEFEAANKVINEMIARKIATVLMTGEMPPPPYTPVVNMISVNYLSSRLCNGEEDRFFRVSPFGHAAIAVDDALFDEANLRKPAGQLFIGVGDCEPGQALSFLFRFAEGTGSTDKTPPAIQWKYLADNDWKTLPDECQVADGTYGLQTTGILQITLPLRANNRTTLFDVPGLYWFSAVVEGGTDAFPGLIGIDSNAVQACFMDQGNDPGHAGTPLPPGSISKLTDKIPAIKKVAQPLASFGGRVKEEEKEFYTRVSERLRHKSRAVNNWDYEHLVLENFPSVFKIKCLNDYWEGRAVRGHVTVVPICDLQNRADNRESRLKPRASYALLREIEQFLAKKTSAFVQVHAINPELSHVLIRCRVKFKKGVDKGYALVKLENDLVDLLTPWTGEGSQLRFSVKIYASNVISYIGGQEYVDYVEGLEMMQYSENEDGSRVFCRAANQDISLVETQFINGHTLLVSAPVHKIELIE